MIMSKFRVGDKVRCTDCLPTQYIKLGEVYTVQKVTDGCIELEEIEFSHDYLAARFELVPEPNPVLTPEEVFDHLRKGTKLQCRKTTHLKWCDTITGSLVTDNPTFKMITLWNWRIKPEPEVIELNGKRYKLIEE